MMVSSVPQETARWSGKMPTSGMAVRAPSSIHARPSPLGEG
jgi:hypothetical protein